MSAMLGILALLLLCAVLSDTAGTTSPGTSQSCRDVDPHCDTYDRATICSPTVRNWAQQYCARYCGLCTVQTSTSTTTPKPTTSTTTPPPTTTNSSMASIQCQVCRDHQPSCEIDYYHEVTCTYPNNYCINHLLNHDTGVRKLTRRCGNIDTCVYEWYQGTSDNDRCTTFDPKFIQTLDFECTFCCTTDNCNMDVVPSMDSLFKN